MSLSERSYRFLLRAYPRGYRPGTALGVDVGGLDGFGAGALLRTFIHAAYRRQFAGGPARRCIFFARSEASSFSRRVITIEHLLLGVLREEPSLIQEVALETVAQTIKATEPPRRRRPTMEELRLSEEAIRLIAAAKEITYAAGRRRVAPADLRLLRAQVRARLNAGYRPLRRCRGET